jgi:hypothetical protein
MHNKLYLKKLIVCLFICYGMEKQACEACIMLSRKLLQFIESSILSDNWECVYS